MYRTGIESILGLQRHGAVFSVDPCIPGVWPEYRLEWRYGTSRYSIHVDNAARRSSGVSLAELDGIAVNHMASPLSDDGRPHDVRIVMGAPSGQTPRALAADTSRHT
jgi:cyclic beta-1,2-glucan synthetase